MYLQNFTKRWFYDIILMGDNNDFKKNLFKKVN